MLKRVDEMQRTKLFITVWEHMEVITTQQCDAVIARMSCTLHWIGFEMFQPFEV